MDLNNCKIYVTLGRSVSTLNVNEWVRPFKGQTTLSGGEAAACKVRCYCLSYG